jgi:hypothetical protein
MFAEYWWLQLLKLHLVLRVQLRSTVAILLVTSLDISPADTAHLHAVVAMTVILTVTHMAGVAGMAVAMVAATAVAMTTVQEAMVVVATTMAVQQHMMTGGSEMVQYVLL